MNTSHHEVGQPLEFSLPNVGKGPAHYETADLTSASGVALVVLLRNHYCPLSRRKVRRLGDRIGEFEAADVPVVAVLPDTTERADVWEQRYGLPFPFLADPSDDEPEDEDRAPSQFGAFESVQNRIPRTPGVIVVETDGGSPTIGSVHSGENPQDCPSVDEMIDIAHHGRTDQKEKPTI